MVPSRHTLLLRIYFSCLLVLIASTQIMGQENPKNWELGGYLKFLQSNYRLDNPGTLITGQLIHHRINLKYISNSQKLRFNGSLRNRLFYGEFVKFSPQLRELIDEDANDYFDLGVTFLSHNASLGHSVVDRLYFEYLGNRVEWRIGRQRINWGIVTIWNPNDIFNIYSFTDFDYEERPGSDAVLVKYYFGLESSFEFAVNAADDWNEIVAATKWNHRIGRYDVQWIAGYYKENIALGNGWAGQISDFGFKGEWSWFYDLSDNPQNGFAMTASMDYSFSSGLYKQWGFLFNKLGANSFDDNFILVENLSPKNIYPYNWVIFDQLAYGFSPLWSISYFLLYSPSSTHGLFLQGSINYNLATNWDMSFFGQIWFEQNGSYKSPFQGFFLRLKWSY